MSVAFDVRAYLLSLGVSVPIYVGHEPVSPVECLTIYDTGGSIGESWAGYDDPTIQIRARAVAYDDAYDNLRAVRDALILPTSFTFQDWHYTGFWLISDIAHIGRDDKDRPIFTLNLRLMREPVTT